MPFGHTSHVFSLTVKSHSTLDVNHSGEVQAVVIEGTEIKFKNEIFLFII